MVGGTLGSLLYRCSKTKAFDYGTSLHAVAIKAGMLCIINCNHILNVYSKCGKLDLARQMLEDMPERNIVTWSALISGHDQAGNPLEAVHLFVETRPQLQPNEFIFSSVLSSCASLQALRLGRQIHAQSFKSGCSSISFVSNSLISMYMKLGQCNDAISIFGRASGLTSVSYNAVITGLVENQQPERGFEMFKVICQEGLVPDCFTFMGVLGTCSTPDDLWRGMQLHSQTIKRNFDSNVAVGNVMITMYAKFNLMEAAEKVFRSIETRDIISWNTAIAAFSHCEEHVQALGVFREMAEQDSQKPDDFSFTSVLSASTGLASIRHGKQVHAHWIRTRPEDDDTSVGNALVNMYAKCGCIKYACHVFHRMDCRNIMSWNSIIGGFSNNGLGEKALEMFERMKEAGIKPDSVTFLGLLTACNHTGLLDEGRDLFNSMDPIYSVTPDIEYISCFIDLLGRAGRLIEAEEYMQKYHFGQNPVVLGCLLSACRMHGDVATGKQVAIRLLNLHPVSTSPYVLLSNLYASDEMWVDAAKARKMLKGSGLKKEAGCSLIDVDGRIERFTIDDFSHSRIDEIFDVLRTLKGGLDEELLY